MSNRILGLDLGTSTSAIAAVDKGQMRLLGHEERARVVPSVVGFGDKGEVVVGHAARAQLETAPDYTYTGLKRLLGRQANDPHVLEWADLVAYEIAPGPSGEAFVRGPDRLYSPTELLAHLIRERKETAEVLLSEEVTKAVIGVPAHFDMVQKEALCDAARKGGLEPVRLLSEPTAAAVAYGVDRAQNRTIAIYDFGGGTFDVTILKITGRKFRVLATAGDPFLGGEDFDRRIMEWLIARFKERNGIDLRDDRAALNRTRLAAETAKHELSSVLSWRVFSKYIADGNNRAVLYHLDETLDREVFHELVADLVDRTRQPCREAMRRAKIDPRDIDEVVLVGGMTRMPLVQETVKDIFERVPSRRIDPMAAVALGCAMQGAALTGEMKSIALSETLPMSIGVEVGNGAMVPLLRAGRQIPARETVRFGLAEGPNGEREAAAIRFYQGDLKVADENRALGVMVLNDLAQHKAALVDVTADIDDNGILTMTAADVATKHKIVHRMHAESGMSEEDISALKGLDDKAAFEEGTEQHGEHQS